MIRNVSDPGITLGKLSIAPRPESDDGKASFEDGPDKPDFTDEELSALTLQDFNLMGFVGEGGFSKVFFAEHDKTKKVYALKLMCKQNIAIPNISKIGRNEAAILQQLDSPFIIKYFGLLDTPKWIGLLTELACNDTLQDFAQRHTDKLNAIGKKFFLAEIFLAIKYLQEKDIAHRDIKCENVLLSAQGHAKLADFGFAIGGMTADKTTIGAVGTPACVAPEVFTSDGYTRACDIWSFGVAVFELLTSFTLMAFVDEKMICDFMRDFLKHKLEINLTELTDQIACDLVRKCLQLEKNRISIEEIQAHAYFSDTCWSSLTTIVHKDTSAFEIMKREDFNEPMFSKDCDCLLNTCVCGTYQGTFLNFDSVNNDI